MAHQSTISATTSVTATTNATGPAVVSGHSIGVSITAQSGSTSTVISVSGTTNCSATPSAITVTAASGTYSASFRNVYVYVFGTPVYATTTISGTITAATSAPTHVTLSAAGTNEASTTNITATTWGGTAGGTLYVSGTPFTTWVTNGYSWSGKTRGTSYTFKGKRVLNGVDSTYASRSITVPYLAATQSGALTAATIAYAASTSYTIGFTTAVPSTHDYRINSGTVNSASVTVPATAGNHAFSLQTRRKVASGGDGSTWSSSFGSVNITRSAADSAPSINVTNNDPDSPNVTATINLSSSGSGGTLEYSNGGAWQTSPNTFTQARNTTVSYTARRSASLVSNTVSHNVGYKATTSAGTVTTPTTTLASGASGAVTLSVASIPSNHAYYINGAENGTSITVSATAGTYNYQLTVARTAAGGGSGSATAARNTVSIVREGATSPPDTILLSPAGTASNSISVTATTSGGTAGGTLQVSDNNSSWVTNGTSPSNKTRGTSYTFYGRRVSAGNVASTSTSQAYTPPYLSSASGGLTAATIAYTASTSYTFSHGVAATHDYRINSSSANGSVGAAAVTVPAAAGAYAFTLQTRRKVASGGNTNLAWVTIVSVNITRSAADSAPSITVADNSNVGPSVTATITLSSPGSGGTGVEYSNGGAWSASTSSFAQARDSTVSYTARRSGINLASNTVDHAVGYIATTSAGTVATPTTTLASGASGAVTLTVSGIPSNHAYYINGVVNGTSITVSATAGTYNYQLTVARTAAGGGSGSATAARNTVSITRQAASGSAPAISGVADNSNAGTSVTATVSLSSNGSGGTLQYAQTTNNSVTGASWQTSASFTQARNTTKYYWAKQSDSLVSSSTSYAVGYLTGDTSVSATSSTISSGASSASTTISSGTSGETYAVRLNNGSTNIVTRVGNGSLTIPSSSLPSGTNTTTYEIFVRRPTSTGGDGSTYTATNDTFTVTRSAANNPNPNAFTFSNVPAATEGTVITSNAFTLAGMDVASTVTALNNCSYKIGSGSWYTTIPSPAIAVPVDSQITIRTTSSSTYGATVTAHVTVGTTQSTTWSVTTRSDPAGVDYGVQVMNANGTNEIFGYNVSTSHIVAHGSISIPHSQSRTISNVEGLLVGNANTVGISVSATVPLFGIYLTSTRGTGQFTIANSSTLATVVARYMVFRY